MALTGTDRGKAAVSNTTGTSGNAWLIVPASNLAAGSMAVLVIAVDNAHAAGAAFTTETVTDTKGNTWTRRQSPLYDPAGASAGVEGAFWTTPQDGGALLTSDTISVVFDTAPTAKAWALHEVVPAAGSKVAYVTGGVSAGSASASPTVTTSSIANAGHMVIGAVHAENTASGADLWVDDADTSNGSWSTGQHTGITASTSGIAISSQRKVVTATATQTYNPTSSAGTPDSILSWIDLREDRDVSAGLAASTGAANAASANIQPTAGLSSGTGASFVAAPGVGPTAGLSSGTGSAFVASASVDPVAGNASGTGTAFDATVSTLGSGTDANAELASGSGQALGPSVGVAPTAGHAAASGSAFGSSISIAATAGNAVGSGSAFGAGVGGGAIAWGLWSDIYCNPVGVAVGHPARKLRRIPVSRRVIVDITGTVEAVVAAPDVIIEGIVNDDEVVLELLASLL